MSKPVVYYYHTQEVEGEQAMAKLAENVMQSSGEAVKATQIRDADGTWTHRFIVEYRTPKVEE